MRLNNFAPGDGELNTVMNWHGCAAGKRTPGKQGHGAKIAQPDR
ncbi:hypothetical protein [Methylophilus rhizosphaerae]|nr:hypothetical protein [Methylophilus rhizosphaerae]